MKKVKFAAITILIHGIIEIMGPIGAGMASATDSVDISEYMHFIVPFFQDNIMLITLASFVYGVLRIISAVGLFRNREWGMKLAKMLSLVTIALMMFILPAGIMDGVLAGIVLVLLLIVECKDKKIID